MTDNTISNVTPECTVNCLPDTATGSSDAKTIRVKDFDSEWRGASIRWVMMEAAGKQYNVPVYDVYVDPSYGGLQHIANGDTLIAKDHPKAQPYLAAIDPQKFFTEIVEEAGKKIEKKLIIWLAPIKQELSGYLQKHPEAQFASMDVAVPVPYLTTYSRGKAFMAIEINVDRYDRLYFGLGVTVDPTLLQDAADNLIKGKKSLDDSRWKPWPVDVTTSQILAELSTIDKERKKEVIDFVAGHEFNLALDVAILPVTVGGTYATGPGQISLDRGITISRQDLDFSISGGWNYSWCLGCN